MPSTKIIFRNPIVDDRLIVKTDGHAKVLICNLQGQVQFPEIDTSGTHYLEFDFRQKPSGMYILKVMGRRSVKVYRFLKPDS